MDNKIMIKKQNQLELLKLQLNDKANLDELQMRIDLSEKNRTASFENFSDLEMLQWFLYEQRSLDKRNDRSERTIKEYKNELFSFIQNILNYAYEINIDLDTSYIIEGSLFKSLDSRHLRRYQEWLATKSPYVLKKGNYSAATLERKTAIIRAFFRYLHDKGYIEKPIYQGLRIATTHKDDRPNRDLGPQDVIALLDAFRNNNHPIMFAIIHVLTTTGIRNEEFCTLKVKDLKRDSIHGGYFLDVLGKGNKRRQVPLKKKVYQSILMFRHARGMQPVAEADPEAPLFTTNTGKAYSPSYFSQYVKKEIIKINVINTTDGTVTLTPHVFRHAFAIISKINGVDVYEIMRSLGHEKIDTTMIYLEKIFHRERHAIHSWKSELFGEYI